MFHSESRALPFALTGGQCFDFSVSGDMHYADDQCRADKIITALYAID